MSLLNKSDTINNTYEVKLFIGQGAFGEVYSVNHKFFGIQVLKVFKEKYIENSDIDTVINEARILSSLSHENIVRVFEVNDFIKNNKKHYFITMGFVHGETLSDLLKRKISLDLVTALKLQIDLLKGLSKAHSNKIVHRDICPDNILICHEKNSPKALLSDFGLSQNLDQLDKISGVAGKVKYFAPECSTGIYLPTSDVFSSGMVFYKMITGLLPWSYDIDIEDSEQEITRKIFLSRRKKPISPSLLKDGIDEKLSNIILKSLSLDIEKRYNNSNAFLKELVNFNKEFKIFQ